jgi:hypothetical protein
MQELKWHLSEQQQEKEYMRYATGHNLFTSQYTYWTYTRTFIAGSAYYV